MWDYVLMLGKTKWTHGIILNFATITDIAEHIERKPVYFNALCWLSWKKSEGLCVSASHMLWWHTATLQVCWVGLNLVKSGNPVAGSSLHKYPKVLAGLVSAWLHFHVSWLWCRHALYCSQHVVCPDFFVLWNSKGCSRKYSAEFQVTGIAISDWGVDACTA